LWILKISLNNICNDIQKVICLWKWKKEKNINASVADGNGLAGRKQDR
jgi:hypothetical protein